jgi:uncharacterized protein YbjT (DUF2867 family)
MVLAAGATGRLRPVVHELLARGHAVRVTARDPEAPHARYLARRGAEVVRADLDDGASLRAAAGGADAAFVAGSPHQAGPAGETRHGINAVEAADAGGVGYLVYASGAGAEERSGVPVFDSKHAVEQRLRELAVPHAILAPVYFMENAFNPWNLDGLAAGRFPLPLPPNRSLQQLAIADFAAVAVRVIERSDAFAGQRIELAGDELTGAQAAAAVARVTGRDVAYQRVPLEHLPLGLRVLFGWLERTGHAVGIPALRRRFPDVDWHSFERWAATQDWPVDSTVKGMC